MHPNARPNLSLGRKKGGKFNPASSKPARNERKTAKRVYLARKIYAKAKFTA